MMNIPHPTLNIERRKTPGRWTSMLDVRCSMLDVQPADSLELLTYRTPATMPWVQRELRLPARRRGFHLITREVVEALPELANIACGLLHVFLQHTSASLTINENADPDVPADLSAASARSLPKTFPIATRSKAATTCRLM